MKLANYITDMAKRRELAALVDSDPDYIWQIATGRRKAGHKLARKIEVATGGDVSIYDLRSDIYGLAPKRKAA